MCCDSLVVASGVALYTALVFREESSRRPWQQKKSTLANQYFDGREKVKVEQNVVQVELHVELNVDLNVELNDARSERNAEVAIGPLSLNHQEERTRQHHSEHQEARDADADASNQQRVTFDKVFHFLVAALQKVPNTSIRHPCNHSAAQCALGSEVGAG